MENWTDPPLFALIFCAGVYLLYRRGLVVTKEIAAVFFVFRPGRTGDRVTLNGCSGWARHAVRLREGRTYVFSLDMRLSGGEAEAVLLDQKRRPLLRLNRQAPSGSITPDGTGRRSIRWEFRSASGTCELRWEVAAAKVLAESADNIRD